MKLGLVLMTLLVLPMGSAQAIPAAKMCSRAVAESRMVGNGVADCLCLAEAVRSVFHPALYEMWIDALYAGEPVGDVADIGLTNSEVERQFASSAKAIKARCGIDLGR